MGARRTCGGLVWPLLILATLGVVPAASSAAPLTRGNVLVTTEFETSLLEYTRDGDLVQAIPVPYPAAERPRTEGPRDILATSIHEVLVYNGTFAPFLSTHDVLEGSWSHRTHPGWKTSNNISYGGIAISDSFVYVTSLGLCCGEPSGIVRFDRSDSSSATFHGDLHFIDLTIGRDGLLYALHQSERSVSVFDPRTMERLRFIALAMPGNRGIAVDEAGHIFAASEDSLLYHFDQNGTLLASVLSGVGFLTDIDLSSSGDLAVGAREAEVVLTNKQLTELRSFKIGTTESPHGAFVAFVEPDPNRPPDCAQATATLSALSASKHTFAPVTVGGARDPDGDEVLVSITGVTQDEPVTGKHSGKLAPDAIPGSGGDQVLLRRERNAHGDGRIYSLEFAVSDGKGGTCEGSVTVGVSRHEGRPAVDSAPPGYDSFGS